MYLRIDDQLKQAMREYAERKHVDLSTLVTTYFLDLLQREQSSQDVEQL